MLLIRLHEKGEDHSGPNITFSGILAPVAVRSYEHDWLGGVSASPMRYDADTFLMLLRLSARVDTSTDSHQGGHACYSVKPSLPVFSHASTNVSNRCHPRPVGVLRAFCS